MIEKPNFSAIGHLLAQLFNMYPQFGALLETNNFSANFSKCNYQGRLNPTGSKSSATNMLLNLDLNSLAVWREIAHLTMLHSFYYNYNILPDSVILKCSRCANIRFKPIIHRVQAFTNSFIPLTA